MNKFTVVKVKIKKNGGIREVIDLDLRPMTQAEAETFKSKMVKPSEYRVVPFTN